MDNSGNEARPVYLGVEEAFLIAVLVSAIFIVPSLVNLLSPEYAGIERTLHLVNGR